MIYNWKYKTPKEYSNIIMNSDGESLIGLFFEDSKDSSKHEVNCKEEKLSIGTEFFDNHIILKSLLKFIYHFIFYVVKILRPHWHKTPSPLAKNVKWTFFLTRLAGPGYIRTNKLRKRFTMLIERKYENWYNNIKLYRGDIYGI